VSGKVDQAIAEARITGALLRPLAIAARVSSLAEADTRVGQGSTDALGGARGARHLRAHEQRQRRSTNHRPRPGATQSRLSLVTTQARLWCYREPQRSGTATLRTSKCSHIVCRAGSYERLARSISPSTIPPVVVVDSLFV
jgi:hypothetical protein